MKIVKALLAILVTGMEMVPAEMETEMAFHHQ